MESNKGILLAKRICQSFVNDNKCRSSFEVEVLLSRADAKEILESAINKGLRIAEADKSQIISAIWQAKTFASFRPIGSQSIWH